MDYDIIDFNDDIIGKSFTSKRYGNYTVIGATNIVNGSHRLFCCEFSEPYYLGLFRKDHILDGAVRNPYYPSIFGVACMGNGDRSSFLRGRWMQMIKRCYNPKSIDYKYYGAVGVTVCKEWLCFENYCRDVVLIDGYDYSKALNNQIELDKDFYNTKLYSPATTIWVPSSVNKNMANEHQINHLPSILGISPTGECFIFKSKKKFADEHNLTHECISRCILGKQKYHKGWKFMKNEDTLDKL